MSYKVLARKWRPNDFSEVVGQEHVVQALANSLDKNKWSKLSMKLLDSGDVSDHPYQTQFEVFFNALAKGKKMPLTDFNTAARSHEVIFAADLSAKKNKPIKLSTLRA